MRTTTGANHTAWRKGGFIKLRRTGQRGLFVFLASLA